MADPQETIADDDLLYRRLASDHLNPDGAVNSNAFKRGGRPDPQVSVDLARRTSPAESAARAGRPGFGLGVFAAGVPRALQLTVRHDPRPENSAHCLIEGLTPRSRQECRLLAEATTVVVAPSEKRFP